MSKVLFQKGHIVSKETSEKISKALTGKKLSLEHRKNISLGHLGQKAPKTAFKKGHIPWSKGKTNVYSKEVRENMSKSHKGKPWSEKQRKNIPPSLPRGKDNVLWKGGKMSEYPENERIRKSLEMKLFRKACMERDNFTDQKTGERGGRLVVHHINNFADFPELRTSIENGITLSIKSHREFHHIYGTKNNTREQLLEFLNNK